MTGSFESIVYVLSYLSCGFVWPLDRVETNQLKQAGQPKLELLQLGHVTT